MNVAFVIALCAAFAGFALYLAKRNQYDELKDVKTITFEKQVSRAEIADTQINGSLLNKELVREAIIFNGFIPQEAGEGWFSFKFSGDTYYCSYGNGTLMQFRKQYQIDLNDPDVRLNLMKEASVIVIDKTLMGRIAIDESLENPGISFLVTGVEMTYEHLTVSFMEYIKLLDDVYNRYGYEYGQLLDEERRFLLSQNKNPLQESNYLS